MYYILYSDNNGNQLWELVSGETALQIRLDELEVKYHLHTEDDVVVFLAEDAI